MLLKKREDLVGGGPRNSGRKEGMDDGRSLMCRRQESCGAVLSSGAKSRASEFGRKEGLATGRVVQLATKNERESGELKVVEFFVGRKEVRGVASSQTVGKFRKRKTLTQETKFYLGVVEGRE